MPLHPLDIGPTPRHTSSPQAGKTVEMTLDYDLLTAILEHIETTGDGQTRQRVSQDDISRLDIPCDSFDAFAYHFDLLAANDFIDGQAQRVPFRGDRPIVGVDYFGLTLQGHELLDSMRNDGVWTTIMSAAKMLGVEGLKQIPALAVAALKGA